MHGQVVFEAVKRTPPVFPQEFAPLDSLHVDDELVYNVHDAHLAHRISKRADVPGTESSASPARPAGSLL